jgi:mono/diheme cytochrome c family protein
MKNIAAVLVVAIVALALLAVPIVAGEAEGKVVYQSKCAMCHGADGVAKEMIAKKGARNFNDPAWQKERTDEALTTAITDGMKEKGMPAYKEKLKAEEIQDLVKFIRTLAPAAKK